MLLKEKIAVISGVGSRFGKAAAHLFSREGATVILISRNQDKLNKVVEEIKMGGGNAIGIECDATNQEDVKKTIADVVEKFGKIDILLNNAGGNFTKKQKMHELDIEFWDNVISNNVKSAFLMSKNVIPYMKNFGRGSIINVSASHKTLLDGNTAYAAAKSGIIGLTKNLARELRDDNIRVNCIKPGVIRKDFNLENLRKFPNTIKRKGNSEDVAFAALYFASDNSSWVTGQEIIVDGGEELFLNIE